jgi:HNH endonuclease
VPPTTITTPDLKCAVDKCKDPVKVKKHRLCAKHYTRWQRYGTPHGLSPNRRPPMRMSPEDRFFWYLIQEDEHWIWTGPTIGRDVCDYGRLFMGQRATPRTVLAHRWSYEYFIGEIPEGCELDHVPACRITICCNPWHLEPVPHKTNVLRGVSPAAEHARKESCPACGRSYSVQKNGRRRCNACYSAGVRDWMRRTGRTTGEGTGARNREKTHCSKGHEYTPENTYISPKKGRRDCLTCRKERNRQSRERLRIPVTPNTHCSNGHEYTPENTDIMKNGRRSCRTCRSDRRQRSMKRERIENLKSPGGRNLCPIDCTCGRHTRSGPRQRKSAQP